METRDQGRLRPVSLSDKMVSVLNREPLEGLTIKAALLLGFGLTFGIWLFAGYYFTKRIGDVERRAAAINARYMQAQELLSTVRAQVLLGSVYVRDALLDPDPATADDYRRAAGGDVPRGRSGAAAVRAGAGFARPSASVSRGCSGRSTTFASTMLQVLATDSSRWPTDARVLLRTQIVPKRELVIRVSEEVQALNRSAFVQQQAEIAEIYGVSQRRLWESLGLALAASFGIALARDASMPAASRTGFDDSGCTDVQNARELQHLSAKLITAQEEERRSIARELHDEVGQVLTAIKVELAVAAARDRGQRRRRTRSWTTPGRSRMARSTTVRDLSHLLHPALLDDLGLPAAVEWYLRGFGRRHDIRAEVLHDRMDERLAPEIEASAYRIVQEALTNVAKHARATTCRVYLQRLPNTVLITIEDDGAGFDPADDAERAGARAGLGLHRHPRARVAAARHGPPRERAGQGHPADRRTAGACSARRNGRGTTEPARPVGDADRAGRCSMAKLRILLGDDHTLLRQGLRKILQERPDWEVVAEAGDGREAVRQALAVQPDVAILDIGMPLLNGIEATRQIVRRLPDVRDPDPEHARRRGLHHPGAARPARKGYLLEGLRRHRSDSRRRRGRGRQVVLQPGRREGDARRLRPAPGREGHRRSLRLAVRARARDLPAGRRRAQQQGNRRPAVRQPGDGRDPSRAHPAEARRPQHRGARAVRRAARRDLMT